ncbi:UvrD-helicase domain-containing protein [Carboxylicivirga sp. N1Y90]|uniref:UvrD-helicase domain-containing protein n=1 Tax=Carboxylicivirga fragile TaxID=3417571 RepID=UPI003D34B62C|nr:UvrD-helicase domain-containing protein [Marinilabiliaceae bacterium N1Y90]
MSQLKIYRASAGSGKTYTLSFEFIKLLFADPLNYKSILAVTFTNKATSEMKNRILENLHAIEVDEEPDYLKELMALYKKDESYIRKVAKTLLINILNDFSKFSVNTIDSFFQKVIRSFAYEANLPAAFKVELDSDRVLTQAVDELLRELELKGNEDMREWLIRHTLSKIEDGRDWNISNELKLLGKEVFKEEFQSLEPEVLEKLRNKNLLNTYRQELNTISKNFEKNIKELASKGIELIKQHGISPEILHLKSRSPLTNLQKLFLLKKADDLLSILKFENLINAPENCFNNKNTESDNSIIIDCFNAGLNQILIDLHSYYLEQKSNYFTAKSILVNLNALGIATDIALKVQSIARNENLFLLADSNRLLHQIIDQNDAPFIYEKIGTRFQHYMIDEFQDTSNLQWNNFKPLLENSVSEDKTAMIVGDVKQSIYRWRNSDWKLLSEQVQHDFNTYGVDACVLETNWRSFENVITFNNIVFEGAAKMLQNEFIDSSEAANPQHIIPSDLRTKISNAYSDTVQNISAKSIGTGGYVHMSFLEGKKKADFMENATEQAVIQIEELLNTGYCYKDICILVRRKSEGQEISEALLSGKFSPTNKKHPVISNETLLLGSSPAVNLIIQQMKFIQEPSNEVYAAFVNLYSHFYNSEEVDSNTTCKADSLLSTDGTKFKQLRSDLLELKGQALFEMTEFLIRQLPDELHKNQFIFLQGLMDSVRDYVSNQSVNAHDFINWWDEKGQNTAISVPEGQNAINVMTIHKSKGLEFKAVVIPYCNWPIDDKGKGSLIWCSPQHEPFNKLDLVPVTYSAQLLQSQFIDQYLDERLHQFVDNLNLMYVAFTRAEESLVIIGEQPPKSGGLKNVSHVLIRLANQFNLLSNYPEATKEALTEAWNQDDLVFEFGERPKKEVIADELEDAVVYNFRTNDISDRVKIHPESTGMISSDAFTNLKHGKLMHRLFEHIVTYQDIEKAVLKLILNGQIKTKDKDSILTFVNEKIQQDTVKDWFRTDLTIINEGSILTPSGKYRPDRVIINKQNEATVIDYKFGEIRDDKYKDQVQRYMNLLEKMKYKKVSGYLWYIGEEDEIIEIDNTSIQGTLF